MLASLINSLHSVRPRWLTCSDWLNRSWQQREQFVVSGAVPLCKLQPQQLAVQTKSLRKGHCIGLQLKKLVLSITVTKLPVWCRQSHEVRRWFTILETGCQFLYNVWMGKIDLPSCSSQQRMIPVFYLKTWIPWDVRIAAWKTWRRSPMRALWHGSSPGPGRLVGASAIWCLKDWASRLTMNVSGNYAK